MTSPDLTDEERLNKLAQLAFELFPDRPFLLSIGLDDSNLITLSNIGAILQQIDFAAYTTRCLSRTALEENAPKAQSQH